MSIFLNALLCFSLIVSPVMAEVGEVGIFSPRPYLTQKIATNEVENFEQSMKMLMKEIFTKGADSLIGQMGDKLSEGDKKTILGILAQAGTKKFNLTEATPGSWQYKTQGNKISFSLLNLYNKNLIVNGKTFDFSKVSFAELENALSSYETVKSTTLLQELFEKTFGIESAHALGPFVVVVAIVAVVILGMALYELKWKPEKIVKRLNEMQAKLAEDAANCQEARTDEAKYQKTFTLASSVSERSAYNSNSPAGALELALKTQLSAGNRNDEDCYRIMHEAGTRLSLDIPIPTATQIERREFGIVGNAQGDVAGAAINLCRSYNALGSCMSQFVGSHVNDSSINTFGRESVPNYQRYQRSGVTNQ